MKMPLTLNDMQSLRNVTSGVEKADIALLHGDVVDVYSGRMLHDYSVAIKGDWIAALGQDIDCMIGPGTQVIDVSGKVLVPGLVDGHTHLNCIARPEDILRFCMLGGTTTIVNETMEIVHTAGYKGMIEYMAAFENQPVKVFFTVAIPLNLNHSADRLMPTVAQLKRLLTRDDVAGVGEGYWQMVLAGNKYLPTLAEESLRLGKTVEGHGAGAHNAKLETYLAYGVNSDHESTSVEDVLERLRMGVFVQIRQGTIRKELDALAPMAKMNIDLSHVSIVTDGIDPRDMEKSGYLEASAQTAVDLGFDFIKVIQMVTLNPARHFRLDHYVGGIAPAKHADIIVLPNSKTIKPELVISRGKPIVQRGKLLVQPSPYTFTIKGLTAPKRRVKPGDLAIKAPGTAPLSIRIMDLVTELVSREAIVEMTPENGELKPDISRDLLKICLLTPGHRPFSALVRGIGINQGAIASSYIWETYGVVAVGVNDQDIASAMNRVVELTGGIVFCENGEMVSELPLTVGALMTDQPLEPVLAAMRAIQTRSEELGGKFPDLIKTMSVLCTGAIPFLRIHEDGLIDIKSNSILPIIAEG
jgi:adenine deaminase